MCVWNCKLVISVKQINHEKSKLKIAFFNPTEEAFSISATIKSRLNDQDVRHDLLDAHHDHIQRNVNLQTFRL